MTENVELDPIERAVLRETAKRLRAIIREHSATDSKGRRIVARSTLHVIAENIAKKEKEKG